MTAVESAVESAAPPLVRLSRPSTTPEVEEAVLQVLRSGHLAAGPWVEELEELCCRMAGSPHAVAVANGTCALEAAFHAHGIGPGDEVITTPLTFAATLNSIWHTGAVVRFADVTPDFTLDAESVRSLIGPRTAAVVPVHLYGMPADLDAIGALARRHDLLVVEDAAQAHGASVGGSPVGSLHTATFSFYATKNVAAGEGGVVTCHDASVAREVRLLRNQGMEVRYAYERIGRNMRMTDLHAAVAVPQLRSLDTTNLARAAVARRLTESLTGQEDLVLPREPRGRRSAWHQYTVLLPPDADRGHVAAQMLRAGVETGVYYPKLAWDHDVYRSSSRVVADPTPRAAEVVGRCLSLPVHPGVSGSVEQVAAAVRAALR